LGIGTFEAWYEHISVNTKTGKGTFSGTWLITIPDVGTIAGSGRGKITGYQFSGTFVGTHGTGAFKGVKKMGSFAGCHPDGDLTHIIMDAWGKIMYLKSWMYPQPWEPFYYTVRVDTGEAESNLDWLEGCQPISWCPDSPYWYEDRGAFPTEEYTCGIYVCHSDWVMYSEVYDDTFRYRWWIFWESEEAAGQAGARSSGGCFVFSDGTGDFSGMQAFGRAWVEMDPGTFFPHGYQYHVGWISEAP